MIVPIKDSVPSIVRRSVKIARARAAELAGSDKYSMPALNRLDEQMLDRLPAVGSFLEVGANDGYSQSNTYFLERRRGWSGILIEPNPKLYRICRRIRPNSQCFQFACVDGDEVRSVTLATNTNDLMGVTLGMQSDEDEAARLRGGGQLTVSATTMTNLIERAGSPDIDFMSVDVEGAEFAALGGLDLARCTPTWLLVETDYPDRVDDLLGAHMERADQLSHHDHLWRRR